MCMFNKLDGHSYGSSAAWVIKKALWSIAASYGKGEDRWLDKNNGKRRQTPIQSSFTCVSPELPVLPPSPCFHNLKGTGGM
eukprot:2008694-Amphidinium_carterae.2